MAAVPRFMKSDNCFNLVESRGMTYAHTWRTLLTCEPRERAADLSFETHSSAQARGLSSLFSLRKHVARLPTHPPRRRHRLSPPPDAPPPLHLVRRRRRLSGGRRPERVPNRTRLRRGSVLPRWSLRAPRSSGGSTPAAGRHASSSAGPRRCSFPLSNLGLPMAAHPRPAGSAPYTMGRAFDLV
ncbi:hypothetical protein BS78_K218000 [Paspalum vaginatum]|uniref:Uncharacterized protein n=1 Tax=Paspalum vaginatum TaxID=158149 RepID=A0A9W7X8T5_9POAL|nr:hypothetical protein BS78_K218000 [Paspalum vaginatum]